MALRYVLLFLFFGSLLLAQERIITGNVYSEDSIGIMNVNVINVNTNQKVLTDRNGLYIITTKQNDVIRFIKNTYERKDIIVRNYSQNERVNVKLNKIARLIEEVKIKYKFNGDLKKDIAYLNTTTKKQILESELSSSIVNSSPESYPTDPRDFNQSPIQKPQVGSVDFVKAILSVAKLFKKPGYRSTGSSNRKFLKRIKEELNTDYYRSLGMTEYDIDRFLAYADSRLNLEKLYYKNIDINVIDAKLKKIIVDFDF